MTPARHDDGTPLMEHRTHAVTYGLWLLCDDTGQITLTGWSETGTDSRDPAARPDYWPVYDLCADRASLPQRLAELGLELAPGADLHDLDRAWDVYVQHPDLASLKAVLERQRDTR